jgi:hypothetical protein
MKLGPQSRITLVPQHTYSSCPSHRFENHLALQRVLSLTHHQGFAIHDYTLHPRCTDRSNKEVTSYQEMFNYIQIP